ncbi:hypothetical protein A5888_004158 [Enterococcus sp. 9E7_DIV0242]|uniref:ABC3 transporter permease C-terminal domain-containing protein n=1 Tax=Candidatus Enterococcus clewellii TaxID=1834193 RepID=A0A242K811_9ENTE|nr:hypothetical protein A5888_002279 [Enterococcus sp. 9E7_DIV0242]
MREVKHSFMRFLSIAILIALGTSFFIGLKSAAPNILTAGNRYFAAFDFYDLRLISADGISEEQAKEIAELAEIKVVARKQVVHQIMASHELSVEVDTYENGQYEIIEGRAPKNATEILLDAKVQEQISLGDKVSFKQAVSEEERVFQQSEFKVVGFANSYRFLSKEARGATTIGNGELNCFAAVVSAAFAFEGNVLDIRLTEDGKLVDRFEVSYLKRLSEVRGSLCQVRERQQEEMKQSFENKLSKNETELQAKIQETKDGLGQLENQISQLSEVDSQSPEEVQQLISAGITPTDTVRKELEKERGAAAEAITTMENELNGIEDMREAYRQPTYEVQGINQTVTFNSFKENIQCLDALGNILPVVFFFVACLITVSIITRMIEQERKQIGTLKALGVKSSVIMRKYSIYSILSGSVGLLLGILAGNFLFSKLLIDLYVPLYILKEYELIVYWPLFWIAVSASLLSIVVIPYFFYRKTLGSPALHLMRAKPPIKGRKILLEYMPIIWNRCSFSLKMSLRTIFRYKLRMLLLFIGIMGCMVLLVVGYGAKNAVSQLQDQQFNQILHYDMLTVFNANVEKEELESYYELIDKKEMKRLETRQEKWHAIVQDGEELELTTLVPLTDSAKNELGQYIQMVDSVSKKVVKLGRDEVFISKKMAQLLHLKEGDYLEIKNAENEKVRVPISRIVDNYYLHYLYIGEAAYKRLFNETISTNTELLRYHSVSEKDKKEILEAQAVNTFTTKRQMIEKMDEVAVQLDHLIAIVIIAACVLGLVVIYNLSYINILERKQELSVVYAMGYRPIKRTMYIFREMNLLVMVSIVVGYYASLPVYKLVINQLELKFLKFPEPDQTTIFLQSAGTLVVVFCLLVVIMHQKIKKMDVLGALKDRE